MNNAGKRRLRTKRFALRVIHLYRGLPRSGEAQVIGRQLLRCGTAVGAHYRAACRARSRGEFIARLGVVLEESDESVYWLELLVEASVVRVRRLRELLNEANQLTAIFAASLRSSKERSNFLFLKSQIANGLFGFPS